MPLPSPVQDRTAPDWAALEARLRAYVTGRVPAAVADDLLQDILLRLVVRQATLWAADHPQAWTLRVAANVIADYYRRAATEQRLFDPAADSLRVASEAAMPDDPSAAQTLATCLPALVRDLPPIYREALQVAALEERTQAGAAAQLGVSLSGMKSRLQRARGKLQQALSRCCTVEVNPRGQILDYQPHSLDSKPQPCR